MQYGVCSAEIPQCKTQSQVIASLGYVKHVHDAEGLPDLGTSTDLGIYMGLEGDDENGSRVAYAHDHFTPNKLSLQFSPT